MYKNSFSLRLCFILICCELMIHLLHHRFLLAILGMLTGNHHGNEVSLIVNSGVLALVQSLLRQMGKCLKLHIYLIIPLWDITFFYESRCFQTDQDCKKSGKRLVSENGRNCLLWIEYSMIIWCVVVEHLCRRTL